MDNENILLEKEMDIPSNWVSNTILTRDGKGNIVEIMVGDDDDVGDN